VLPNKDHQELPAVTAIPPRSSGIYQILCVPTGKIYIGSAIDLRARWEQHRHGLRRGAHHNFRLQQAWDKYGEPNFEFSVLEFVEAPELLVAEQRWIDSTGCTNRNIGFNIFDTAGSPGTAFARIWEGFIDPEGNEVTITNLFDFCRQHDLDWPSMHRLARGKSKLKSSKGWTHKNSVRKRAYIKTYTGFITPDGQPAGPITNLAAFCREHGLDNTHMVAVANGRICSHHGWTHEIGRQAAGSARTYTGFINPDGQHVVITNLMAFCREHGLHPVHMHALIKGRRKSHKGWTWREDDG
jgi:group I intron endonuclease